MCWGKERELIQRVSIFEGCCTKGCLRWMNGAPSIYVGTHTHIHTSLVKCHFLNVPRCRASHLPSAVSLPAVRAGAVSKVSDAPYANTFLFFMMRIHSPTALVSSFHSFSQSHFFPSLYQSQSFTFLHYITCPQHMPFNPSSFPSSSLLCSVLCSQISVCFAGWLTLEGSTRDDSRDVSSLWCSVIVLTMCSHSNSHT